MSMRLILSSKKKSFLIVLLFLAVLSLVTFFCFESNKIKNIQTTIPFSIRQQVTYPIFMPEYDSKSINKETFAYVHNIFQFVYETNDVRFTVFQQPKPQSFDLAGYSKSDNMSGSIIKSTKHGNLLVGAVSDYKVAILETDKTIVTFSTTDEVSNDMLIAVINSFIKL